MILEATNIKVRFRKEILSMTDIYIVFGFYGESITWRVNIEKLEKF